jgi:hypothetical protein
MTIVVVDTGTTTGTQRLIGRYSAFFNSIPGVMNYSVDDGALLIAAPEQVRDAISNLLMTQEITEISQLSPKYEDPTEAQIVNYLQRPPTLKQACDLLVEIDPILKMSFLATATEVVSQAGYSRLGVIAPTVERFHPLEEYLNDLQSQRANSDRKSFKTPRVQMHLRCKGYHKLNVTL